MRRLLSLASLLSVLAAAPALAEPGVQVTTLDGTLKVTLDGAYGNLYYQTWRADAADAPFRPLISQYTMCLGDCFLTDPDVVPGRTYWYRFDLQVPSVGVVSYGPYAVTVPVTPLAVHAWPNPSRGRVHVQLTLPGSNRRDGPVDADARVLDVQGRTVRVLHAGPLARGNVSLIWDGLDDRGRAVEAGVYLVRLVTPLGSTAARVARIR